MMDELNSGDLEHPWARKFGQSPDRTGQSSTHTGHTKSSTAKGCFPSTPRFPLRNCNILDPLDETNNLGAGISKPGLFQIRSALGAARDHLLSLIQMSLDEPQPLHTLPQPHSKPAHQPHAKSRSTLERQLPSPQRSVSFHPPKSPMSHGANRHTTELAPTSTPAGEDFALARIATTDPGTPVNSSTGLNGIHGLKISTSDAVGARRRDEKNPNHGNHESPQQCGGEPGAPFDQALSDPLWLLRCFFSNAFALYGPGGFKCNDAGVSFGGFGQTGAMPEGNGFRFDLLDHPCPQWFPTTSRSQQKKDEMPNLELKVLDGDVKAMWRALSKADELQASHAPVQTTASLLASASSVLSPPVQLDSKSRVSAGPGPSPDSENFSPGPNAWSSNRKQQEAQLQKRKQPQYQEAARCCPHCVEGLITTEDNFCRHCGHPTGDTSAPGTTTNRGKTHSKQSSSERRGKNRVSLVTITSASIISDQTNDKASNDKAATECTIPSAPMSKSQNDMNRMFWPLMTLALIMIVGISLMLRNPVMDRLNASNISLVESSGNKATHIGGDDGGGISNPSRTRDKTQGSQDSQESPSSRLTMTSLGGNTVNPVPLPEVCQSVPPVIVRIALVY